MASPRPRPGLRVCSAADMPLPPFRAFLFFLLLFLLVTSAAALLPCFLLLVPLLLPPLPLPLFLQLLTLALCPYGAWLLDGLVSDLNCLLSLPLPNHLNSSGSIASLSNGTKGAFACSCPPFGCTGAGAQEHERERESEREWLERDGAESLREWAYIIVGWKGGARPEMGPIVLSVPFCEAITSSSSECILHGLVRRVTCHPVLRECACGEQ